jgi:hypothetical protein
MDTRTSSSDGVTVSIEQDVGGFMLVDGVVGYCQRTISMIESGKMVGAVVLVFVSTHEPYDGHVN